MGSVPAPHDPGYDILERYSRRVSSHRREDAMVLRNGIVRYRTIYIWPRGMTTETPWDFLGQYDSPASAGAALKRSHFKQEKSKR